LSAQKLARIERFFEHPFECFFEQKKKGSAHVERSFKHQKTTRPAHVERSFKQQKSTCYAPFYRVAAILFTFIFLYPCRGYIDFSQNFATQ